MAGLDSVVTSMASFQNKNGVHPWWAVAEAVKQVLEAPGLEDAAEFLREVYDKEVGT
jgi:hypothetical protein